jgi:chromatin remodeling complex protein RSC6
MKNYDPEKRRLEHLQNRERDNLKCKEYALKHKEERRLYLQKNKEKFALQRKLHHEINKEKDNERERQKWNVFHDKWFKDKFCSKCGTKDDLVFHHVDKNTKETDVTRLKRKTDLQIQLEIDKCVVLCRSCHMKIHNILYFRKDMMAK